MKERKNSMTSNKKKVTKDEFRLLKNDEYMYFKNSDYTIVQLKKILSNFRLKISGNKSVLVERIENYLKCNYYIKKIQKNFRGYLVRHFLKLRNPYGIMVDISQCSNENDFSSLEYFNEIPKIQHYVYIDNKNFQYAFKISSLIDYLCIKKKSTNPYNRIDFSDVLKNKIKEMNKINNIISILPKEVEENYELTKEQEISIETTELFQIIDFLGNYSDVHWFLNLSGNRTYRFLRELEDIWNYRAQLSHEMKCQIYPPNGKPFYDLNLTFNMNTFEIKKYTLKIIRRLITSANDNDSQSLGALFILSALTLVSNSAAQSMPWLYESVVVT